MLGQRFVSCYKKKKKEEEDRVEGRLVYMFVVASEDSGSQTSFVQY